MQDIKNDLKENSNLLAITDKSLHFKARIIPIFISHLGCPNQCVFCDQKSINGNKIAMSPALAKDFIREIIGESSISFEIAFFGGSFTGINAQLQEEYLSMASEYGFPIRVSTRPDYINDEVLERLLKYGVRTIELGVQSMDDHILELSGRGHTVGQTRDACYKIQKSGLKLGIQTMIGLPDETLDTVIHTASEVTLLSPDIIRIYPVLVLKDTDLEMSMNKGEYTPLTLETAAEMASVALKIYRDAKLNVIRVGLQSTDEISARENSKVCGGPNHPAFRQLAESTMLAKIISAYNNIEIIYCGVKSIHLFKGHNDYGLKKLEKFSGRTVPKIEVSKENLPEEIKIIFKDLSDTITIML